VTDDFENSIAHAARDRSLIAARWSKSFIFRAARKLMQVNGQEPEDASTIACYPPVEDLKTAADLYNRLHWYYATDGLTVTLPTPHAETDVREAVSRLNYQPWYLNGSSTVQLADSGTANARLADADIILVWDASSLSSPSLLRRIGRIQIVDTEFYSTTECSSYLYPLNFARTEGHRRRSVEKFRVLSEDCADADEAHVFATGPSLSRVFDTEIPERAVKVVCNSMVRNDDLLSHIQPDVLTFADPVFHYGPSEYAAQFRADAVRAIKEHDCWCVVSPPGDVLLQTQFPEVADRIIGIPARSTPSTFHFPRPDELWVRSTANIMTLLMLPVASALTDHVHVFGADGREEDESYFWEHSSIAQYDGLMNSAVQSHPSFFRDRLYTDYYDQHVERLRELVEFGEAQGKQYDSLTPSHVPVLHERKVHA